MPLAHHCLEALYHLSKNYDASHCLSLIGVTLQCTKSEYYIDIAFSELGLYYLLLKYAVVAIVLSGFIIVKRTLRLCRKENA